MSLKRKKIKKYLQIQFINYNFLFFLQYIHFLELGFIQILEYQSNSHLVSGLISVVNLLERNHLRGKKVPQLGQEDPISEPLF